MVPCVSVWSFALTASSEMQFRRGATRPTWSVLEQPQSISEWVQSSVTLARASGHDGDASKPGGKPLEHDYIGSDNSVTQKEKVSVDISQTV